MSEHEEYDYARLVAENARFRTALEDIANGRLRVTDAMLESKEAMQTAIAEYSQTRARKALANEQQAAQDQKAEMDCLTAEIAELHGYLQSCHAVNADLIAKEQP